MTDITIIVATYDRPRWLAEELASINMARERVTASVRVLVVDDAGMTSAAETARRFGADYLHRPVNGGVAATLAAGFDNSDSTYTSFWGDDDIMLPNWFELNLARAAEGYDVVANSYNLVGPDLELFQSYILPPVTFEDLKADIVAANDGALLRREVAEGLLRPERERAMMLTLWLALAAKGARFTTITEPTWLYRRHSSNMSGQLPLQREPRFAELRREAIEEYR